MAIVCVLVLLLAGPAAGHEKPPPGLLPPGDWTDDQVAQLLDLIDRTEAALPAFSDPSTLDELGFYDFGVTAPGGWDHWINPGWIDDGHLLDPEFPEALVFRHTEDGGYQLEAAMFVLASEHDLSNIPEDLAGLPGWHTHEELCVDDQGRFAGLVDLNGECVVGHPSDLPPMMHVWIVDNACGHRFGGIGVGGLECDVDHDGPGDGDDPGGGDHGGDRGDHGDDHGDGDMPPAAPPARPVQRQPNLTG